MKRVFYLLSIITVIIMAVFIGGCIKDKPTYELEFPNISEDDGYAIDINGVFDSVDGNKYKTYEGEDITFTVLALEGFTFKDIVVRDNGDIMEYTKTSTDYEESYEFKLKNVNKPHKITVEGIEAIKFNLSLNIAKYRENSIDTEGILPTDYDASTIRVKYNNVIYPNLLQAVNAINNLNIKLEYGKDFEIWIGESYANYYTFSSFYSVYVCDDDFNGILREKQDDQYVYVGNTQASWSPESDENGNRISENNMYKYVIKNIKQDMNLYIDTIGFQKNSYPVESTKYDVYEIEAPYSVVAGEDWSFLLKLQTDEGFENVNYENMKVYINGYNVTGFMTPTVADSSILKFTANGIVRPTPSSFSTSEFESYHITVGGVDLSAYELAKVKVETCDDMSTINYYAMGKSQPFYYEDGYYYFEKIAENIAIWFSVLERYNYENMQITINGVEFSGYQNVENGIQILITPQDGEYLDTYDIVISGVEKALFEYKIKNDYANEVDLFLIYGENRELVTTEKTISLVYTDSFRVELIGKKAGQDVSKYAFVGFDEKENGGAINEGISPADIIGITIVAEEETASENRMVKIQKNS